MGYPTCPVFTRALQAFQESIQKSHFSLQGSLCRAGDVNMKKLAAQVPQTKHSGTTLKVSVGHKPTESMDRRDLRRLPSQLPYLKQNQQDCSPSRFWFNYILKDFPWWGSSGILFQCFISLNKKKKKLFLRPDINISAVI